MKRALLSRVVGVLFIAVLGGCATPQSGPGYFLKTRSDAIVYVDPTAPAMRKIALMPFKAPTELIGGSVSELFVTEILKANRYTLVERSQIKKVLGESELAMSGMTAEAAVEVGALIGADGVIIGTVDQYESKAVKGHLYPVVGITFRLIDCTSGKIAWSCDLAKQSESKKASLSIHVRSVVHEMMSGLYKELLRLEPPTKPCGVKVSELGLRSAKLTWSSGNQRGAVCVIERSDSKDGPYREIARISESRRTHTDKGLEDASTYYYKMTALGKNGVRSPTVGPHETFTAPPPVPPAGLEAESDMVKSVPLTWDRPKEMMYVSGYIVERSTSKGGPFKEVAHIRGMNTLTYVDGGTEPGTLADDTEYYYQVITVNEAGAQSGPTSAEKAHTREAPPAVKSLVAISAKPREIPLAWKPSEDKKVAGYIINRFDEAAGDFVEVKKIPQRTADAWTDRGNEKKADRIGKLKDGTGYKYQIAAYNIGGARSEWSDVGTATTKKTPGRVQAPECEEGLVHEVALEWKANREKDIASYVVACAPSADGQYRKCGTTKEPRFKHLGRQSGTEYFYKTKAIDTDTLEGEWSAPGSATTKPCPDAPAGLTVNEAEAGFMLSWKAPAQEDVTSYIIEKKGMLSSSILGYSIETHFLLTSKQVGKSVQVYVASKDKDGLISQRSELFKVTAAE